MKTTTHNVSAKPTIQVNQNLSLEEQIAQRANEIWHQRGRKPGSDFTDWMRAECEVYDWHQRRLNGN